MAVKVGELYQELRLDDKDFNQGMQRAEKQSGGLANALKVGLAGAAIGVGAAFVGMAKTGLDNMKAIDDAAKNFQVSTGASADEAEDFKNTIQELHKVNTDSYEELGEAVTELRRRHGDASKGMEQDFLDYAKVTGQDTAQAVEHLHDVQMAWGQDIEDQTQVMDTFMAIHQETGIAVEELQGVMAELAPVAGALGMEFDETAALLGHFETMGVDATTATRGLRNAMARIEEPTKSQAESLQKLGVEVKELEEGVYSVSDDAFEQLITRLSEGELSSEELSAAMDILGRRAGVDMVRALENGEAGVEELMAVIKDSKGTVSEASDVYDKQLGERWELIKRKYLEPFMETIGTVLIGMLEKFLDFIDEWGPKISAVFQTVSDFVSKIFGSSGEVSGIMADMQERFGGIFGAISEIIEVFTEAVSEFWDEWGEDIMRVAREVWDNVKVVIDTVLGVIEGILNAFISLIKGDWDQLGKDLKGIWNTLWEGIRTIVSNVWGNLLKPAFDNLIGNMQDVWRGLIKRFKEIGRDILRGLADGIKGAVSGVIDGARDAAKGVVDGVKGFFGISSPSRVFIDIGENLMNGLGKGIDNKARATTRTATDVADDIEGIYRGMNRNIESSFADTFRGVLTEAEDFGDALSIVWGGLKSVTESLFNALTQNIASALMDSLGDQIAWVAKTLANIAKVIVGYIQQAYAALLAFYGWAGPFAPALAAGTLGAGMAALGAIASKVVGAVGLEKGGLVTGPTFAQVGEGRDHEAVIPLNDMVYQRLGQGIANNFGGGQVAGGYGSATFIVELDGRTIARAVEQPLADRVRIKGGVRA